MFFLPPPKKEFTPGLGCNSKIQFLFSSKEFTLKLFQDLACEQAAEVVLDYTLEQLNDSTFLFKSDRLNRSNFAPLDELNLDDLPVIDGEVSLVWRNSNEFVTYLEQPKDAIWNNRPYQASYIRYRRFN